MPTEAEREEIIRQLLKLLDEIEEATTDNWVQARVSIARRLVRKLSPSKSDGDAK